MIDLCHHCQPSPYSPAPPLPCQMRREQDRSRLTERYNAIQERHQQRIFVRGVRVEEGTSHSTAQHSTLHQYTILHHRSGKLPQCYLPYLA